MVPPTASAVGITTTKKKAGQNGSVASDMVRLSASGGSRRRIVHGYGDRCKAGDASWKRTGEAFLVYRRSQANCVVKWRSSVALRYSTTGSDRHRFMIAS